MRTTWYVAAGLLAMLTSARAPAAQSGPDLDDAAARIQYAFYTADSRSLQGLLAELAAAEPESASPMREYYLAYGNWRLAEVYADQAQAERRGDARSLAARAVRECVAHAEAAYKQDARLAEAYALDAICSSPPARASRPGEPRPAAGCSTSRTLKNGLEIEPANPRIRLIEVLCSGSDRKQATTVLTKLRGVVSSFDNAPPARPGRPDWGHAEALLLLGQTYLERGESVQARDAIERALVLAPDYKTAQQLLQVSAQRR